MILNIIKSILIDSKEETILKIIILLILKEVGILHVITKMQN